MARRTPGGPRGQWPVPSPPPATMTPERDRLDLLTPEDLAALLQLSLGTLARWRRAGTGPVFIRIGNRVRYAPADLDVWLRERRLKSD